MITGAYQDEEGDFILPYKEVDRFPDLLEKLEEQSLSYNLKQNSLEDAFLNFTNLQKSKGNESGSESDSLLQDRPAARIEKKDYTAFQIFWMQFMGIFLKRWYSFKRDWRMWLIMVIPSLLISAFLLLGFRREFSPNTNL